MFELKYFNGFEKIRKKNRQRFLNFLKTLFFHLSKERKCLRRNNKYNNKKFFIIKIKSWTSC